MANAVNIEIFSCAGGMAEGFRRAGITFDLVIDWDENAVASYEKNLGHRPVRMDARDFLRLLRMGWRPAERVNLVVADPPCTPWSRAGKRLGTADERDMLHITVEIILLLRPLAYLIGNVPGLDDSTAWGTLQRALAPLGAAGYCIADYTSLDAADYGVPQHRVRPFWFGHLGGGCIRWPAPTHEDPARAAGALTGLGLRPWVTCRDALQHLPLEELGRPVRLKRADPKHPPCEPDAPGTTVRSGGNGNSAPHMVLGNRRHPPASPASPASTIGAKDRGQSTVLLVGEERRSRHDDPVHTSIADAPARTLTTKGEHNAARLEWPWDRPGTVVHCDGRLAPVGHHVGSNLSGPNAIVLSERAAATLQGFPEGWLFAGDTKKARWSQIGQAMPPALAHAVGNSVAEAMRAAEIGAA